ncbi:MAG: hypothetical protein ACN4GK_00790 [Acidimicrobiia bacterium]
MNRLAIICILLIASGTSACSSDWSDAELRSVESYCEATAGGHAGSCASWIDGIHRLSNCDTDQAKRVIDRVISEYNGAPAVSIAEGYELVGCEYGAR